MASKYAAERAMRKLTTLVLEELNKKEDDIEEIGESEVAELWEEVKQEAAEED